MSTVLVQNVAKGGGNVELVTPEAGPWSSVAKYLQYVLFRGI